MSFHDYKSGSDFEVESHDLHLQAQIRNLHRIDAVRAGATLLVLLMGMVALGVSAHSINVYNTSHPPGSEAWLSLWPDSSAFDFRPTVALVVGACIVVLANAVTLLCHHSFIRRILAAAHTPLIFAGPFVALVAALAAMIFFYAVNASNTHDTLLSWSCRWRAVGMDVRPHFGTLCRTSQAGVYLAILLIPMEVLVLGLAGWQLKVERFTAAYARARKSPSPVMA